MAQVCILGGTGSSIWYNSDNGFSGCARGWSTPTPPAEAARLANEYLARLAGSDPTSWMARRRSTQADFSLIGLVPFTIPAVALALAEPRAAYAFIWPVLTSSLIWIVAILLGSIKRKGSMDWMATVAALPFVILFLQALPGIIMSDGMKSLNILAGVEVALLVVILPAIDGLLVHPPALQ